MSKKKNIFIPCDKANHICNKAQYKEASLWEKCKLALHLVTCKTCNCYSKNNIQLTNNIKKSNIKCLDQKCKDKMKKKLDKALKEQPH